MAKNSGEKSTPTSQSPPTVNTQSAAPVTKRPTKKGRKRNGKPEKSARGRPTIRTPANADRICNLLANGKSLIWITRRAGLPSYNAVLEWLQDDPVFSGRYARAREDQGDYLAEEIIAIADDAANDARNPAAVQRARLRIEARKWVAAKLKPKKYGDRLDLSSEVTHKHLTLDELEQRLAEGRVNSTKAEARA